MFDGNDPIYFLEFLSRLFNEAIMLSMSEVQELITLPTFLAGPTETHFCTNLSGASCHGEVTCWPESIQYLLRTNATAFAMSEVLEDVRSVRQKLEEAQEEYLKCMNEAILRC